MKIIGASRYVLASLGLLAIAYYVANATDPNQLQDFCVATSDSNNGLFINGLFCKNPLNVTADDFLFQGLDKPANTNNRVGFNVTRVRPYSLPGLNTLGISISRVDIAPNGVNTPHHHPRATEVITILQGRVIAGFVTSNFLDSGENKLYAKMLNKGDVYVFPQGMMHFEVNIGKIPVVAISAFSSQNPGTLSTAPATFGAKPSLPVEVLARAFRLDPKIVKRIQSLFSG